MAKTVSLPQARIPIGWATVQGNKVAVEIDPEWMIAFAGLLDRSGGVSGDTSFTQYINQFYDAPLSDPAMQEASRGVDELRHELASTRSDLQAMRSMVEQLMALIEMKPSTDYLSRIEQIEGRLM